MPDAAVTLLCCAHQLDQARIGRRGDVLLSGQAHHFAIEVVDFRGATCSEIFPGGRTRQGINGQQTARQQPEYRVRRAQQTRQPTRRQDGQPRRSDTCSVQHAQGFILQQCQATTVGPQRQLVAQRQIRQAIDRIVQIEQHLGPLHLEHVVTLHKRQPGRFERCQKRLQRRTPLHHQGTGSSPMQPAMAAMHHVEAHHAGKHGLLRQLLAQRVDVAHAILQTQHDHTRFQYRSQLARKRFGVARFDRDQYQVCRLRRLHFGGNVHGTGCQFSFAAIEVGQPQAVLVQQFLRARAANQAYRCVCIEQAANKAADAARAGYSNSWRLGVHVTMVLRGLAMRGLRNVARQWGMRMYLRILILATILPGLNGCYYLHLASGEAHVLMQREPIARVLADPQADQAIKDRLRLALAARQFASATLDLPRNRSYTLYADIGRPYVMYNVYATPPLSLKPVEHCFPVAGCVAYQGFYSRSRADAAAARQKQAGNDTAVSGVVAYSTLGHFADPVLSSMMRWDNDQLVGTIFHELAHQKLYVKGDTAFNESFATFVEREGLKQWHAAHGTAPSDLHERRRQHQFTELILATRRELEIVYASKLDDAVKAQRKQQAFARLRANYRQLRDTQWHGHHDADAWMAQTLNNARLLPFGLYDQGVPAFAALFRRCGGDWDHFHAAVAQIAAGGSEARAAFLHSAPTTKADDSTPPG